MKKLLLSLIIVLSATSMFAQDEKGTFTLQPKVGVSLSNISNAENSKVRIGFTAGIEAGYQATDQFEVTLGAEFSQQGYKHDYSLGKETTTFNYINVPVLANYYVATGLAVKAGIQPGFLLSAKSKQYVAGQLMELDNKGVMKKVDFSIPIGISYEYQGFILDARYQWGLTKVSSPYKNKNEVIQVTFGYKFLL